MDVGGGDQGKCVNETAYYHVAEEAAGFPGVCAWVCVCAKCARVLHVGCGVRAGVMHGVKFQG